MLTSVLEADFALTRVTSGRGALDDASDLRPDLVLLDMDLVDMRAADVCRALFTDRRVSTTTPVLLIMPHPPTFKQRLDLVRAGARDGIGLWMEPDAVSGLCRAFVDAKRAMDLGMFESLIDTATGLYTWQGLVRRARELGALVSRHHQGLACLVFALELPRHAHARRMAAVVQAARGVQQTVRLCDTVGRPGNAEFAVLAPATNADGAVGLANRLSLPARAAAAGELGLDADAITVRAGYDAVDNLAYKPLDPATLLLQAGMALHSGEPQPRQPWLRRYAAGGQA
jgi:PleD family two-component response regulator